MTRKPNSEFFRQASARKILAGVSWPAPPFRVEPFTGGPILKGGRSGKPVTDNHIVDARGRTVFIVAYDDTGNRKQLRQRAESYALGLNELTA